MTISTRQQKQLCARLSAVRLFLLLASVLHDANQAFSIIFAEASASSAVERVRLPKNLAGLRLFSSSTGSEIPAAQLSLKPRLSVHLLILR